MVAPQQPDPALDAPDGFLLRVGGGPILSVTDEALARVGGYGADGEAMWLDVTGEAEGEYVYSIYLGRGDAAGPGDVRERHGDLDVVVPAAAVELVRGATVDWAGGGGGGLVVSNPNKPAPRSVEAAGQSSEDGGGASEGSVAERVTRVLEEEINPGIADHGGQAELVEVEGETARLRLNGGCQGCGLASVTLTQGIETALTAAIPEITRVIDVTDHAAGTAPWLDPAVTMLDPDGTLLDPDGEMMESGGSHSSPT